MGGCFSLYNLHTSQSSPLKKRSEVRRGLTSLRCHLSFPRAAHSLSASQASHNSTLISSHQKVIAAAKTDYGAVLICGPLSFPQKIITSTV